MTLVSMRKLLIATVFALSTSVQAQPPPNVEPRATSVATTGRWSADQSTGQYRLIVTTEGWEHLWSRVFVEWLPDPTDRDAEWKASAVAELVPPVPQGTCLLEATAHQGKDGVLLVAVRTIPNPTLGDIGLKKEVSTFEAGGPGIVTLRKPQARK